MKIPEIELIKMCFEEIDNGIDRANEIIKDYGAHCDKPSTLILNEKEYLRPPK